MNAPELATSCWGLDFPNPVGLAAGFDKDARVPDAMLGLGFGFVETGTVTPRPQAGNPRPRIFRLGRDHAVVNRLGFNNHGLEVAAGRLAARRRTGIVGANIGCNKDSDDKIGDYVQGLTVMAPLADYLVVNVSSPNTPGLRDLQTIDNLRPLLEALLTARAKLAGPAATRPLCVKIAPDLADGDAIAVARLALDLGLDGLSISNTTITRPDGLTSPHRHEAGGLSGRPMFARSTQLLAAVHVATQGRLPLIGLGGVASAADAYAKIRAGATLVQLYTALVYAGPRLVQDITDGLADLLRRDGFARVGDAVGADHA
jgi:dihydroorotate dehydrogenase